MERRRYALDLKAGGDVARRAVTALIERRQNWAVPLLIEALKSQDTLRAAARALGDFGDTQAVLPLIAVLKNEGSSDLKLCRSIAASLYRLSQPGPVRELIKELESEENIIRVAAATKLISMFPAYPKPRLFARSFTDDFKSEERHRRERAEQKRQDDKQELEGYYHQYAYTLGEIRYIEAIAKVNNITPLQAMKCIKERLNQGFSRPDNIGKIARSAGLSTRIPGENLGLDHPPSMEEIRWQEEKNAMSRRLEEHRHNIIAECLVFLPSGNDRVTTLRRFEITLSKRAEQYPKMSKKAEEVF